MCTDSVWIPFLIMFISDGLIKSCPQHYLDNNQFTMNTSWNKFHSTPPIYTVSIGYLKKLSWHFLNLVLFKKGKTSSIEYQNMTTLQVHASLSKPHEVLPCDQYWTFILCFALVGQHGLGALSHSGIQFLVTFS